MKAPFFSIVTPVFNGGKYIEETIKSVINQTIDDYEYIIVDNLSTDGTLNIINKYSSKITRIISEKDAGMYDALNKGFSLCKGKYFFWLNSDDFLKNEKVLEKLKSKLNISKRPMWVNCQTSFRFEKYNFSISYYPYFYPKKIIQKGWAHNCAWGFIQQESTIFDRDLFKKSGGFNSRYKMAGDFYLWKKFSEYTKLTSINLPLGVQRKWSGQMQNDLYFYYKELNVKKCIFPIVKYIRLIISFFRFLFFRL